MTIPGPVPAPPDSFVTLEELATPEGFAAFAALLRPLVEADRQAHLTVVHYAVAAVGHTLLRPLLADGVVLAVVPADLAIPSDPSSDVAPRLGRRVEVAVGSGEDAVRISASIAWHLIGPVAAMAVEAIGGARRGVTALALDALLASARRTARELGRDTGDGWEMRFLEGTGHPDHDRGRDLLVRPDSGPPVRYVVPRVCCVLARTASPHACPTCPQLPGDDARTASLLTLLRDLSDDDFVAETGRARVVSGQSPHAQAEE